MIMNETKTAIRTKPSNLNETESLDHILWDDYSYRYNCEHSLDNQSAGLHLETLHFNYPDD